MNTNAQTENYSGQTTTGAYWGQPQPNTCPGCGRCRDCGRPYETQPYFPWPGYPNPYIGDAPYWPNGITWTSSVTTNLTNGPSGLQAWN
jgi:hypothetical protein